MRDSHETVPVGHDIKLGQFIKYAGVAESGAHARELIDAGMVRVNGKIETRRGHLLHLGDMVECDGNHLKVG